MDERYAGFMGVLIDEFGLLILVSACPSAWRRYGNGAGAEWDNSPTPAPFEPITVHKPHAVSTTPKMPLKAISAHAVHLDYCHSLCSQELIGLATTTVRQSTRDHSFVVQLKS